MNEAANDRANSPVETTDRALHQLVRVLARGTARELLTAHRPVAPDSITGTVNARTDSRSEKPSD